MLGRNKILLATAAALAAAVLVYYLVSAGTENKAAEAGEARSGGVTVNMDAPLANVRVRNPELVDRPLVVIDPGHGGSDPGTLAVSGKVQEKALTLALAQELADLLVERGRVRVALTRDDDRYLTLQQRPDIAKRLGAALFLSIHMDSAPNADAKGATVYSLSDIASSAEAARFAKAENIEQRQVGGDGDDVVRAMLADVSLRDQMRSSADMAEQLVDRARGSIELRPSAHQFANFHVLRHAEMAGVLFEAGYLSNADEEKRLTTKEGRAPTVRALAQAIEADAATRRNR